MSIRRIFLRRDTAANWSVTSPNPIILAEGEPGFDTTNQILKIGDGVTPWNSLTQFQGPAGPAGTAGPAGAVGADGASGDSAYQTWVNAGNSGTEQDFLDSLIGADGEATGDYYDFNAGFNSSTSLPSNTILSSYSKSNLPLNATDGTITLVTDGSVSSTPTMAYFYQGSWYRTFDNSEIVNQTIDLFIIAGQSNAHGHADVSDLTSTQATQDGLFYTSWHNSTSNAETTQNYSNWATSLVAGSTRGDSNNLVNSPHFGPELGFVSRANAISLTTQPIGIIKYAVGASTLNAGTSASDWDTTATGTNEGDCYRGLISALSDATTKLTNAGYSWNFKGMIWWQGESGATVSGLNTFIAAVRTLLGNSYGVSNTNQFPVVITKIGYGTDLTPVANADAYVGIVDAATYGHSASQNHVGRAAEGSSDTNSNGVNDMFDIGEAYADQMQLAISGSTNAAWDPSSITTRLWLDMDDQSVFTSSSGNVTQIADKSGNNYTFNAANGSTLTAVNTAQNNKNILRFDGNSDATSYRSIAFSSTAVHKWFFVVKVTASDSHDGLVSFTKSNPTLQILLFNLSGNGVFSGDWYFNPGNNITSNPTNLLNQWVMLSMELDIPNNRVTASLNATPYATNVNQSALSTMGSGSIRLNDYQNNADSDWGEVIFTEDVTQTNSDKIEGYLAHKWGLTSDLPSSHPYKTQAP